MNKPYKDFFQIPVLILTKILAKIPLAQKKGRIQP